MPKTQERWWLARPGTEEVTVTNKVTEIHSVAHRTDPLTSMDTPLTVADVVLTRAIWPTTFLSHFWHVAHLLAARTGGEGEPVYWQWCERACSTRLKKELRLFAPSMPISASCDSFDACPPARGKLSLRMSCVVLGLRVSPLARGSESGDDFMHVCKCLQAEPCRPVLVVLQRGACTESSFAILRSDIQCTRSQAYFCKTKPACTR